MKRARIFVLLAVASAGSKKMASLSRECSGIPNRCRKIVTKQFDTKGSSFAQRMFAMNTTTMFWNEVHVLQRLASEPERCSDDQRHFPQLLSYDSHHLTLKSTQLSLKTAFMCGINERGHKGRTGSLQRPARYARCHSTTSHDRSHAFRIICKERM